MLKFLTAWILTDFLAFVPKMTGGRMGTAFQDRQIQPREPLLLNNFSLTSEKFFLFLPLPTACCLLPTAASLRPFFKPNLSLNRAILSLNQANLSLNMAILSLPEAYLSLSKAILSPPKRLCSLF
jgi:hypothetical protein